MKNIDKRELRVYNQYKREVADISSLVDERVCTYSMYTDSLFERIDSLCDQYVEFCKEICDIESPTSDKASVDEVGEVFIRQAEKQGWAVEIFKHQTAGNVVVITMNPGADGAPVIFSGHMDTVHPKGSFGYPPTRVEDGIIYGPGVIDCKGGIAAALMAMEALKLEGFTARPITLMLQTDEEGGSSQSEKATINYMCKRAQGAAAFLNLEPYERGKVCIERKGILTLKFKIEGKETHSAFCARAGANAIAEAAHKIIEMEKLKDDAGITCNCGVISGGSVANTVAGYCEFLANIRFATNAQLEWVKDYAHMVADTVFVEGCSCTLEHHDGRLAMEYVQRNVELLAKMNRVFKESGLPELVHEKGNFGSDAAEITSAGVPCIDSLGVEGGGLHSQREYALISSIPEAAKRMAAVALGI